MDWKKLLQNLKRPKGGLLVLTYVLTFVFCVGALVTLFLPFEGIAYDILCYTLYGLAGVTLGYTVYTLVIYAKFIKRKTMQAVYRIPLFSKMLESFDFRYLFFLVFSMMLTIAYGIYNGTLGILYASVWYGSLAAYYIFLSLMRSSVLFSHTKIKKGLSPETFAIKTYRRCGYTLIVTILALSGAILQMILVNATFKHEGILIYVSATFAFYNITMSIIDIIRTNKQKTDFTIQSIVNIKLAESLVSILNLQTAMFYSFGDPTSPIVDLANALTGGVVCLLILLLGVFMIVRGTIALKQQKNGQTKTE